MKKVYVGIIAVMLIIISCFAMGCQSKAYNNGKEVDTAFDDLTVKPVSKIISESTGIETSKVVLSETPSSDIAVKESASYLFNLANDNASKVEYYASIAEGSGSADVNIFGAVVRGNMSIREMCIRDGASWYMQAYGQVMSGEFVSESGNQPIEQLLGMVRGLLDFAERRYTPDGKTFYTQRGKTSCLNKDSVANFMGDNCIDFSAVDKKKSIKATQKQYQEARYIRNVYTEIDNALINSNFLKNASIVKNNGYYTVTLDVTLDTEALNLGKLSLRQSAGSENLEYTKQVIIFEVWDCGLFRQYSTDNGWKATISLFEGSSKNTYSRYFTYNKENVKKLVVSDDMTSFMSLCKEPRK